MSGLTSAARRGTAVAAALLIFAVLSGSATLAGEHELGLAFSSFSAADDETERTFDIDSGPIPSVFYRYQFEEHAFLVSAGFESWSRREGDIGNQVEAELDFFPIVGSYRYLPWHEKNVSLFVGGAVGLLVYDATARGDGFVSFLATETGALTSLEPLAGVEVRAGPRVRFHGEVKYSWQLYTASDLDLDFVVLDVDMGGFYATLGVSFALSGD